MRKLFFLPLVLVLVGCGSVPMFMDLGEDNILRGSASGALGSEASFTASDISGSLECNGKFPISVTSTVSKGTVQCSNGSQGSFRVSGRGAHWIGEGVFENGKTFKLFVNYLTDPNKR